MSRIRTFALLLLALAAGTAFSQGANPIGSNSQILLNVTGASNLSLTLNIPVPNVNTPCKCVHVPQSEFTAQTTLHLSLPGGGSQRLSINVYNPDVLAANNVSVVLLPTNGTSPFSVNASLAINPATPSGLYNITVYATGANVSSSNTVLHLRVFNPTNQTFVGATFRKVTGSNETSTAPTNATQQGSTSLGATGAAYLYVAGIAIAIVVIVAALLLRRSRA